MIYELNRNFSSTDRGYKFIISLSNKISPEIRKLNFSRSESWARARSHKSWRAAQEVSIRERQVRLLIALERVVKKSLFGLLMCAETIIESHFYYTRPRF